MLGVEDVALIITPEILNTVKSIHIDLETALANLTPEPTNMSDTDSDHGGSGSYKIKTQLAGQENYERWLQDEKILWEEKGCAEHVEKGEDCPVEGVNGVTLKQVRRWKKLDTRVKRGIRNNCESGPLDRLGNCTTSKEMLSKLQQAYGLLGFTLIQGFLHVLASLNNSNDKNAEETITHFHKAVQGLETMGTPAPVIHKVSFFINAFKYTYPNWYQSKRGELTKLWNGTTGRSTITEDTLDSLIRELSDHASTMAPKTPRVNSIQTKDLAAEDKGGNSHGRRFTHWSQHHEGDGCRKQCAYCRKNLKRLGHGHTEDECNIKSRKWKLGDRSENTSNTDSNLPASDYMPQRSTGGEDGNKKLLTIHDVKTDEDGRKRLRISIARVLNTQVVDNTKHDWQFDTAASIHVCNQRSSFTSFTESKDEVPWVLTLGGFVMPQGVGTVGINIIDPETNEEVRLELESVYYMPESPTNLLSGIKLMKSGYYHDAMDEAIKRLGTSDKLIGIKFDGEAFFVKVAPTYMEGIVKAMNAMKVTGTVEKKVQRS